MDKFAATDRLMKKNCDSVKSRGMAAVQIRYIVRDVDAAIEFYRKHLGFEEVMHPAPAFAMLSRGDLRLVLRFFPVDGG